MLYKNLIFFIPLKWVYIVICHNTSYNFISFLGKILKNSETLLQHGVKTQDIVQVEIFSTLPDVYPVKRISSSDDASQVIIVRVQTG